MVEKRDNLGRLIRTNDAGQDHLVCDKCGSEHDLYLCMVPMFDRQPDGSVKESEQPAWFCKNCSRKYYSRLATIFRVLPGALKDLGVRFLLKRFLGA